MTLANMKPDRDVAAEEFFEYDAEDFLVFLTLLITEGRTPECSVKGRTEGLHCPPAQSAMPPLHKHECSDKLPQCVQARRVRSEVCVLWRNSIPIMVEVMLLPDCCYGDESPPSDPISDPAIKQDALLLERWTLQPVPRQSGDKFIEEKTLLLAVRSYVFFSQLSAWLSASHGIVPRNILYRISAADKECVCQFSQTPAEHLFPVPNVSQSVALKLRVQSLPRQPTYPTLTCSIHTGLPLAPIYSKTPSLKPGLNPNLYVKSHGPKDSPHRGTLPFSGLPFPSLPSLSLPGNRGQGPSDSQPHSGFNGSELPQLSKGEISSPHHPPVSPQLSARSPLPHRKPSSPLPLPSGGKAVRWLYALTSDPSDEMANTTDVYGSAVQGAESSKGQGSEALRAFKTYSLAEPPRCPSPRPSSSETNPLIGSLLQERQEVIARIAQRLNFCDPTAPHLPPALFPPDAPTKAPLRGSYLDNATLGKTKDPEGAPLTGHAPPSPFNTPISDVAVNARDSLSPKPAACRRLKLPEDIQPDTERDRQPVTERDRQSVTERDRKRERDSSLFSQAVQDITRLIQDRLTVPSLSSTHSPLHNTYTHYTHTAHTDTHPMHRTSYSHSNGHITDNAPSHNTHTHPHTPVCTDTDGASLETDCPVKAQDGRSTLEDFQVIPEHHMQPQPWSSPHVSPQRLPQPLHQLQPRPEAQGCPLLSPKCPRAKTSKSLHPSLPGKDPRASSSSKENILRTVRTLTVTQTTTLTQTSAQTLTTKLTHTTALIENHCKPQTQHPKNQTQPRSQTPQNQTQSRTQAPQNQTQPRSQTPQNQTQSRSQAPQNQTQPRSQPPQNQTQPRSQAPQNQTQPRSQPPQNQTQPRSQPPQNQTQPQSQSQKNQTHPRSQSPQNQTHPRSQSPQNQTHPRSQSPQNQTHPRSQSPQNQTHPRSQSPQNQTHPRSQSPQNQTHPRSQSPQNQTHLRSQSPQNQTHPPSQSPQNQTHPRSQSPQNQTHPRSQSPQNQTHPRSQSPQNQTHPRSQSPQNQTHLRSQSPQNQTHPRSQSPQNQTHPRSQSPQNQTHPRSQSPQNQTHHRSQSPLNQTHPRSQSPLNQTHPRSQSPQNQTHPRSQSPQNQTHPRSQSPKSSTLQDENMAPADSESSSPLSPASRPPTMESNTVLRSPSPLRPCNRWRNHNRHSLDSTLTKAFHPCTGLPLLSSPVPQRRNQTGYFDLDSSLSSGKGPTWTTGKRVKREEESEETQQLLSASAPPANLSLLGNFEECVLNYRLEPLGLVEGFTAEVGASGTFCPSHMTFPVDVSFYSVSDDNAPSPYMGVINLETLGKRGYRVPSSGTIQVTLFNPNKTVVKMFVVVYDLRVMPSGHQTFLRQRTFSVPAGRDNTHAHSASRKAFGRGRILRYLIHLRFQTSRSGKVYLHRDIRLLFSRKSMEVDSGAAYELQSYTESPADPAFSPRC